MECTHFLALQSHQLDSTDVLMLSLSNVKGCAMVQHGIGMDQSSGF